MHFWFLKSEPSEYSWQRMKNDQVTSWSGVCNYQAQSYMKKMKENDLAFFYHTGKEKAIVGVVAVCKEYYYADDSKFGVIDVKFFQTLNNHVTLQGIKQNLLLKNMVILRQPRLSVSPVMKVEWNEIVRISEC